MRPMSDHKKSQKFPHDASYKAFFSHPAMVASLLRDFVREPFVPEMDLGTLKRLSGEYVGRGFTRSVSDTVWRARWREREWCYVALLLEHQSRPDPLMPFRLSVYTGQLLLRLAKEDRSLRAGRFPAVLPIVFYTGDAPWNVPLNTAEMFGLLPEALKEYLLRQKYVLIDLCRLDAGRPELRDSLTALLARFRQAKTFEEIMAVLADMRRVLRNHPDLKQDFLDFVTMWLRHSGVPGNWEIKPNDIEEVHDMIAFNYNRCMEQLRTEYKAECMAAGMAEGMAQGELKNQRETLRRILAVKFGAALPDWLADETDLERLGRLTLAASCADSLAAFDAQAARERGDTPNGTD